MARKSKLTDLGKFVAKLRIDKDVTIADMAKSIGVSSTFVSRIEVGIAKASKKYIEGVIKYFKLTGSDKETFNILAAASVGNIIKVDTSKLSYEQAEVIKNLVEVINVLTTQNILNINDIIYLASLESLKN